MLTFKTADLCDTHGGGIQVVEPVFVGFGGRETFGGPISTVQCLDDNSLVRAAFETEGLGRVLVVDGGGSLRCALLGDQLAGLAKDNGWAGAIVYGCIRDATEIRGIDLGLKALATHPRKSVKKGLGKRDGPVQFAGVRFAAGHYLYADEDGIIVSSAQLLDCR